LHIVCPWCKPLVEQSSLRHTHSAQTDKWTALAACHILTFNYSMTRSAVLPIIQRKYSSFAQTFLISWVDSVLYEKIFLIKLIFTIYKPQNSILPSK
jgi:hypothetical protein